MFYRALSHEHYGQPIKFVMKEFTWLTGGILIGAFIALFIYDWVSFKKILVLIYGFISVVLFSSPRLIPLSSPDSYLDSLALAVT